MIKKRAQSGWTRIHAQDSLPRGSILNDSAARLASLSCHLPPSPHPSHLLPGDRPEKPVFSEHFKNHWCQWFPKPFGPLVLSDAFLFLFFPLFFLSSLVTSVMGKCLLLVSSCLPTPDKQWGRGRLGGKRGLGNVLYTWNLNKYIFLISLTLIRPSYLLFAVLKHQYIFTKLHKSTPFLSDHLLSTSEKQPYLEF